MYEYCRHNIILIRMQFNVQIIGSNNQNIKAESLNGFLNAQNPV